MSVFADLVVELGRLLEPALSGSATAAAIVLFTVLVRLALHPLNRAAFKGATPVAGCLPMLLQAPVFILMYRAFTTPGELLDHRLFAAPLSARWGDALGAGGVLGAQGLVFLALFAVIAVVAALSAVRARRTAALVGGASAAASTSASASASASAASGPGAGARAGSAAGVELSAQQREMLRRVGGVLPLLSFGTLITAAVVPLAAGLYLATTTAWSVAEQAWLRYRKERREVVGGA
ncbi:YidC/Oxa1 family membrane protein insertase [Streptomyces sp. NPDC047718]|uniref:YidC/Oxa1 family membrane protein insertase n=1 Tax=Streptomyces sp. NPDC047718 TaxID=3155479 RepID=UPI0033DB9001